MRLGVGAALVGGALVPGDVEIADGLIVDYGLNGGNGRGCIAVPGFVDLQVNGLAASTSWAPTPTATPAGARRCSRRA
jgi:dihydroorotase-like cyclic amidohydrolase